MMMAARSVNLPGAVVLDRAQEANGKQESRERRAGRLGAGMAVKTRESR